MSEQEVFNLLKQKIGSIHNSLLIITSFTIMLYACDGKTTKDKTPKVVEPAASIKKDNFKAQFASYIHTEFNYTDLAGKGLIIQNSFPKGGAAINGERGYTAPNGTIFANGIFWTRILNNTIKPMTVKIDFPADSFPITASSDTYFKLLLPEESKNPEQMSLYNYGFDNLSLSTFLDSNFDQPTKWHQTIRPNEASFIYVVLLFRLPANGPVRTGFYLEGNQLFYKIDIDPYGTTTIPCGQVI